MNIQSVEYFIGMVPAQMAVVILLFVIAKIPLRWEKITVNGILLALVAYALHFFSIAYGLYAIFLLILLFLYLVLFYQRTVINALFDSLIVILTVMIVELFCIFPTVYLTGLTYSDIMSDAKLLLLVVVPQVLIILLIAYIIFRVRKGTKNNESSGT